MDINNPYAAGSEDPRATTAGSESLITPRVYEALGKTKPWVRLLAVLGFIGSGLMLLGGVFMLVGGGLIAAAGAAGKSSGAGSAALGGMPIALMSILYIAMGILYLFPSLKLWNYGSRIGSMLMTRAVDDLEGALEEQKSFWKFVGVLTLVMIGLYIVLFVVMMVVIGAGAAMSR